LQGGKLTQQNRNDVSDALIEKVVAGLLYHQMCFWCMAQDFRSSDLVFSGTSAASVFMEIYIVCYLGLFS